MEVSPERGGQFGSAPLPGPVALAVPGVAGAPRGPTGLADPEIGHDCRELGMHLGFLSVADNVPVTMSYEPQRHIGRTQPVARARALPPGVGPLSGAGARPG